MTAVTPGPAAAEKPPLYKRRWVIGVVAFIVGIGIGGASASSNVKDSSEYKSLASQMSDTEADLADAQSKVSQIDDREKELVVREGQLSDAQDVLAEDQAAVKKREKAVGIVEKKIAANTIEGDGIYKVGDDIKAGTYKTKGAPGCYYAILRSTNTSDIINNNLSDGPAFVTVRDGQYLELTRCAEWVRQ